MRKIQIITLAAAFIVQSMALKLADALNKDVYILINGWDTTALIDYPNSD